MFMLRSEQLFLQWLKSYTSAKKTSDIWQNKRNERKTEMQEMKQKQKWKKQRKKEGKKAKNKEIKQRKKESNIWSDIRWEQSDPNPLSTQNGATLILFLVLEHFFIFFFRNIFGVRFCFWRTGNTGGKKDGAEKQILQIKNHSHCCCCRLRARRADVGAWTLDLQDPPIAI